MYFETIYSQIYEIIVQLKMVRLWLFLGLGLGLFIEALFKYEFYPQFTQLIALSPRYAWNLGSKREIAFPTEVS